MIIGTKVKDRNGEVIGEINNLIRDSWSGEVKKYIVHREAPNKFVFFSPDDAQETNEKEIKLNKTLAELTQED